MNAIKYIGIDVHLATISIAVLGAAGKLIMEVTIATQGDGPRYRRSVLSEVKPPTGEPDASPPVRFGGRGNRIESILPTPIGRWAARLKSSAFRGP